jgi:hypothetical protein
MRYAVELALDSATAAVAAPLPITLVSLGLSPSVKQLVSRRLGGR